MSTTYSIFLTRVILSTLLTTGLFSCSDAPTKRIDRAGEPPVYSVEADDQEMNEAVKTAKSTFDEFIGAFNSKDSRLSGFFVKYPIEEVGHFEHVWIKTVYADKHEVRGIIDNLPTTAKGINQGDTVTIAVSEITDWIFKDSIAKKIIGAQTIRVLRGRMTTEEQRQLDEELGGTIQ